MLNACGIVIIKPVFIEIWITSSSIFSHGVSLRIRSPDRYSKNYHAICFFGNFIFAVIVQMFCGNHLNNSDVNNALLTNNQLIIC